ncbi:MAG: hypothetical protein KY432_05975 [Acidobacteria bacterium]|nr:hypothetical protein [Acidobacteriota bacterium]
MTDPSPPRLDIISIGPIDPSSIEALHQHRSVSITEIEPRETPFSWADLADAINREIDEAPGWVLLLRQGEVVSSSLAAEIARLAIGEPVAWAFRIPVSLRYAGGPLYQRRSRSGGEIRLFHGRRCRFLPKGDRRELQSRGTVIRITQPIEREIYASADAHRDAVKGEGVPHSLPRRFLIFVAGIWSDRGQLTRRTFRYRWIEAGWDRAGVSDGS